MYLLGQISSLFSIYLHLMIFDMILKDQVWVGLNINFINLQNVIYPLCHKFCFINSTKCVEPSGFGGTYISDTCITFLLTNQALLFQSFSEKKVITVPWSGWLNLNTWCFPSITRAPVFISVGSVICRPLMKTIASGQGNKLTLPAKKKKWK